MTHDLVNTITTGRAVRYLPALFVADKDNNLYDDISDNLDFGMVMMDLDLEASKMSFEARMKSKLPVKPLLDYVAPHLKMIFEDGTFIYEQIGLFALTLAPAEHYPGVSVDPNTRGGSFQWLDGRDLGWLLASDHSVSTIDMAEGANVISDVVSDLTSGGVSRINIPTSSYLAPAAVSWPPGTSRLKRINDRLEMAGYYHICFDRQGIGFSFPYVDLSAAEPVVTYDDTYDTHLVPPIYDEPDANGLCNRVVVIGTDPAFEPIYSIQENTDSLSPVSYNNIGGKWISRTEESPNIQTQGAADSLAKLLLRNGSSYYRTLRIRTLPDPYRQPREVYQLDITNGDGTVIQGKCRCSGWELPLTWNNPVMTHTVNREQPFTPSTP